MQLKTLVVESQVHAVEQLTAADGQVTTVAQQGIFYSQQLPAIQYMHLAQLSVGNSIDLTSLTNLQQQAVNATGRPVKFLLLLANEDNAGSVLLTGGGANGLNTDLQLWVAPDGAQCWYKAAGIATVDSTHKILAAQGNTGDVIRVLLGFGAAA